MSEQTARRFLLGMVAFWLPFGLITAFAPSLMDLFQTTGCLAFGAGAFVIAAKL